MVHAVLPDVLPQSNFPLTENPVTVFDNPQFGSVRIVTGHDGDPWFVAADVCRALELEQVSRAVSSLDDDEKGVTISNTPGGSQEMLTISEPGLYSLVLRSRKKEAKSFKRWITHEVLPAIRRTGGYLHAQPDETPESILARAVIVAQDTLKRIEAKAAALEAQAAIDRPKVIFADAVDASPDSVLIGELAKLLKQNGVDIGQNRLFQWMRHHGFLMSSGESRNMPTQGP